MEIATLLTSGTTYSVIKYGMPLQMQFMRPIKDGEILFFIDEYVDAAEVPVDELGYDFCQYQIETLEDDRL